jgi:hypothetical protein
MPRPYANQGWIASGTACILKISRQLMPEMLDGAMDVAAAGSHNFLL